MGCALVGPLAQLQLNFSRELGRAEPEPGAQPKVKSSDLWRGKPAPHTRRQAVTKQPLRSTTRRRRRSGAIEL